MADGITFQSATPATPAANTEIATDDAGTDGHVQIIKLAISTDGSATVIPADATNGLDVDVTRLPALVAGSAEIGKVGIVDAAGDRVAVNADGSLNVVGVASAVDQNDQSQNSSGLTTATTSYSAGDVMGAGWTFTNMVNSSGGHGAITGISLIDKAAVTLGVELYFFTGSVTFGTDNAAPSLSDSDAEKLIAGGGVGLSQIALPNNRVHSMPNLWIPYTCDATSLYVYARTRDAHTFFGAVTDLRLRLSYVQLTA